LTATTGDCNDDNAAINPGAGEICGDGIDSDCDGEDSYTQTIEAITVPVDPIPIGGEIAVSVDFTDSNISDNHNVALDWGDATISEHVLPVGQRSLQDSHTYTEPGVYTVTAVVSEESCGDVSMTASQFAVIFDASTGFVTGGGWIDSPAGAYVDDPLLTGKANFGFVSKYKKGSDTPVGTTEFQFRAGDLNFHSGIYDWLVLVVAGAKAQFRGTGTINGGGEYKFIITSIDADINQSDSFETDRFQIKIWNDGSGGVIYDNGLGGTSDEDTTEIGGGSIVIHEK
jgi:PKD repeat protein